MENKQPRSKLTGGINVAPAKAGVQGFQPLDSGLRQNDAIRSKLREIEPIEINPEHL